MSKIITYEYTGKGYNPYLIDNNWQVAQLNYVDEQDFISLKKIDRHLNTDEAFVLISGTAVLIAADLNENKIDYEFINMKYGILYNIPKGVWHNIALSKDAKLLIIENSYTHENDFEYYWLSKEQQQQLSNSIKALIKSI